MDNRKILTYFLIGFSIIILLIGTALIIIGSIALNDSKNCSKNSDNSLLSTTPSTSQNPTPSLDVVTNYFFRLDMKLANTYKINTKYDAQSQGLEVLSKVKSILSSTNKSKILSVLSIDNDCSSPFINSYKVIISLVYLNNAPHINEISVLFTSNNVNVLEKKNLKDGYIPLTLEDETCKSFCDFYCYNTTTALPIITTTNDVQFTTTTNGGSISTTTSNNLPFTTTTKDNLIATTTNVQTFTTTTNESPKTTPSDSSPISTTNNLPITTDGSPITTTTNGSLIITTTTDGSQSVTTTSYYNPIIIPSCSTILAIDSSSFLRPFLYQSELQTIKNFSSVISNFEDMLVISYDNAINIVRPFGSMTNGNDFENAIDSINQGPGLRLYDLLETLLVILKNRNNETINTVILITENVPDDISNSKLLVQKLKSMGSISFIIVGTGIKENDLKPLKPTNIYVYDFADCNETELDNKFKNFTTCRTTPYFYDDSNTLPEYPCSSSIIFSIDSSLVLEKDKFEAEIGGLASDQVITDDWNNFQRISLVKYYNSTDIVFNFNFAQTRETFFEMVKMIQQSDGNTNFANLLAALESGLFFYPPNELQNHFIFLSNDITTKDVQISIPYAKSIQNKGKLNFIVLGKSKLPGLNYLTNDDRILYWDYTNNNSKEVLKDFIKNKMACF
uniref:VWFA domain-containing protein n=1 Tax=Strongyloides venezuelensis TaxID=75913 RepID=A0A0K0FNF7_STRVS